MKPYPAYKDSGVEWLGELPVGWLSARLSRITTSGMGQTILKEMLLSTPSSVSIPVYSASESDAEFGYIDDPQILLNQGDLIIGARGSIGMARLVSEPSTCTQTTIWLRIANHELYSKFVYWSLTAGRHALFPFDKTAIPMLTVEQVRSGRIPLPPLSEQRKIAAFLDREVAKIDDLIEEQRRLIALLAEKRQATISHAVTKGLNPNAKLKPSGIDWLGDVPEGWDVVRVKQLTAQISKGTTPTTMGFDFEYSGVRFLKAENISSIGSVSAEPEFYISEEADEALSRSRLQENDLLVVIAGATTGKAAVLDAALLPANTNQAVSFVRCKNPVDAHWIRAWLSTTAVQSSISLASVQSAQPNLAMEDLGNIPVFLPPKGERQELLQYIEEASADCNTLSDTSSSAITLLQERRSALISAAVTGKIDLCDFDDSILA